MFITRLLRNLAYFLFILTLAIDFVRPSTWPHTQVYTTYTSYEDKLWDVFTSCNVSYLMLLLCLSCDNPVAMFLFATAVGSMRPLLPSLSGHASIPSRSTRSTPCTGR